MPSSTLYWSVLHTPGFRTHRGELPFGLLDEFAADVPVPVESLHAVAVPLSDDRLLVCAARREALSTVDPGVERVVPALLPEFLSPEDTRRVNLADLNLLVGTFEPRAARRARVRRHFFAAAAVLLASALLTVGLARRAAHYQKVGEESRLAVESMARENAPKGLAALDQELLRLRLAAQSVGVLSPPADAAVRLAELLTAWPAAVPSKPQSLTIGDTSVAVSVSIDGDPTEFLKAFRAPAGWTMDEPRLNAAGSITRLSLQLKPPAKTTSQPSPTTGSSASSPSATEVRNSSLAGGAP